MFLMSIYDILRLKLLCKKHYLEKRKTQAFYALKRKKQLEEILDRRLRSLETMETMLMKLEASQNDLQVKQLGLVGLKGLHGDGWH